jgi:hypothetical protein
MDEPKTKTCEYDDKHGRTKAVDEAKPSGLTEAGNAGSQTEREHFKNLKKE